MGSPNERAATEEPPVVAGPAATTGRSISVPTTETLGGGGGTTLAAAAANNQQQQQQQQQQRSPDNGGEHNGLSIASQSAKTTASTKVNDDFQSPQPLLDGDGLSIQSSSSRKISASTNSHNGNNSDSGDHQVTTATESASNGTDSTDVTATAMDWTHEDDDDEDNPLLSVSPSLRVSRRKTTTTTMTTTTPPLAALEATSTATATSNPLVFSPKDEPWGGEEGDKEPEAPEVSVTPTPSRAVVNDVLIGEESDNDDDIGSDSDKEEEENGCMEQDSPPVSPPSSSSPTSRSSSVASVSVESLSPAASPTTGGDGQEHYCLRWTNHGSHVLGVFVQLLRDESLVDVTLSAEGRSVRAHKMVLSACSSFFRTLFVQHADQRHPIIILKDTKFEELQSLIQFMYKGEVSVEYGQLATLLKSAENLRVKGLAEVVNSATAAVAAAAAARNKQQATATATATTAGAAAANNNEGDEGKMDEKLDPIVIERTRLLGAPSAREPSVDHQRPSRLHHRRLHPYSSSGSGSSSRRRTLHPHLQIHRASTPPTNHRRGMGLVVDSPLLASTDGQHHPAEDLSSAHRQRLNRDWTPPQRDAETGATAHLLLAGEASQHRPHSHRHRHNLTRLSNHHSTQQLHRQSLNSADVCLDASPDASVDVALLGSGRHHNPDDNDHNHRFKADASPRNSTNNATAASMANAMITPTTTMTTADGGGDVKSVLTSPPPLALINETSTVAIAQDLRQRPTSSLGSSSPPLPPGSSTKPASNHRFSHPWMMEDESEESADGMDADDDVEDEDEEGEEDEAYRHQRRTLKPLNHSSGRRPWSSSSATARHSAGPPQHHPMSLKKETQSDWADSVAAGTSRSEIAASAVDSLRSPGSYSSASSDYGHHIDQFSDDQMPTAEVVIEEDDYINFSGADGLSTDAAATGKAATAIGDAARGATAGGSGKEMRHRTSDRDMANTTSSSRKSSRQGSAGSQSSSHHHSQHHHHHHQQQQQQLLLQHQHFLMKQQQQQQQQHHRMSMSAVGGGSHASRPKKPYHLFADGATNAAGTTADAAARKDFNDEMSVVFNRSLERERDQERHRDRDRESVAGRADISPSSTSSFFSSLLPMVPPLDFAMRFGGIPMQFGAAAAGLHLHQRNPSGGDDRRSVGGGGGPASSRSGGSTPRPGPSSSSHHHPGDEERSSSNASDRVQCRDSPSSAASSSSAAAAAAAATTGTAGGTANASSSTTSTTTARSVASGFPFTTSISLIESHVGVGFTLGSREKPYKCEQCGQCYKYLSAFTKHKEQNHTARLPGEKPFRCEVCGMQFKYLKSFKKHRLNHAVERLHHVYPRSMPSAPRPPFPPPALVTTSGGSGSGGGGPPIGLGLAGGIMEERSVLDMLSRSERSESHHHRHRDHQRHSQQQQDSPLALNRRSRSEERSPSSVRIKTEIEVVSSGEEESNAAEDEKSLDGSSRADRERADRSSVYCPHCRSRFANEDGLRTHITTGCPERMLHLQQQQQHQQHQLQLQHQLQQHPGRMLLHPSLAGPGAISSKFPVGNPASNFLHGALQLQRQQAAQQQAAQATLLAVNYLAARAATASGNMPPPPGLERQVPDVHDQATHGRTTSHDGEPNSDREGSEDGDGSRSNSTRTSIGPSPATGAGPSAAGPWHNLIRDFSAAAAVAAAAAAASGRPPVPPMPNPTAAATTVLPPSMPAAAVAAAAAAANTGAPPPEYDPGRPHLCPFCGKGFRAKENLKLHIRKHTGERPFECEFCGRAFGGKSDMNRHLRIHTGERPYRCDACGKTFARADYLSKHLSTHLV